MLLMHGPVGLGYGIQLQQSVSTLDCDKSRELAMRTFTINHTVNDGMDDMNALRPKFPSHSLSQCPDPRLGRCKCGKRGSGSE